MVFELNLGLHVKRIMLGLWPPDGRGSVTNDGLGLHGCFLVEELDESVDVSGER
jgi:hypothetical protein